MPKTNFPKDFYWGASTASHQVEGGTHNQWTVWELGHAQHLARTAAKRYDWLPVWPEIKTEATKPENYVSDKGVKHFERFESDFDYLNELNLNAFRFGIEWSRLEPEEGEWDETAVEHYRRYIAALKQRGIEPFLNLWHWTVPVWFEEKGGFTKRSNLKYFLRFAQKIAEEYGHDLHYVITLNEPNVYTSFGYITGEWPPSQTSYVNAAKVYWHLIVAHKKIYKIFKKRHPNIQIGVATQLANIQAKRPHNWIDQFTTKFMRYAWNWWFLHRIRNQQDFIGFNYYFTDYYRNFRKDNPTVPLNDLGWYMEPEGLYPLLLRVWARYKKPIFVTENGVADANDKYRRWWLEETIVAMERALSEGVDLRGYMHWSLLDNFEWAYGWWPKFGLVAVDRTTMRRKVRPSAKWFADYLKNIRG